MQAGKAKERYKSGYKAREAQAKGIAGNGPCQPVGLVCGFAHRNERTK